MPSWVTRNRASRLARLSSCSYVSLAAGPSTARARALPPPRRARRVVSSPVASQLASNNCSRRSPGCQRMPPWWSADVSMWLSPTVFPPLLTIAGRSPHGSEERSDPSSTRVAETRFSRFYDYVSPDKKDWIIGGEFFFITFVGRD